MRADKSITFVPIDDKCEECWLLKGAYPSLEWDQLCRSVHADENFADDVAATRQVMAGTKPKAFLPEHVVMDEGTEISIERSTIVLNERELRHVSELARLPKAHTNALPQLVVESEDKPGENEIVYCFLDPDQPYRKAVVRTRYAVTKSTVQMSEANQFREAQGHESRAKVLGQQQAARGDAGMITKLRNHHMCTVGNFLARVGKKDSGGNQPPTSIDGDLASPRGEEDDGVEVLGKVVGLAASEFGGQRSMVKHPTGRPASSAEVGGRGHGGGLDKHPDEMAAGRSPSKAVMQASPGKHDAGMASPHDKSSAASCTENMIEDDGIQW